jgi:hypothetical protein
MNSGQNAISDSEGRFTLHNFGPPPYHFQLRIKPEGFVYIDWGVDVRNDGIYWYEVGDNSGKKHGPFKELRITLQPEAWIEGEAIDTETGKPVRLKRVVICSFERKANGEVALVLSRRVLDRMRKGLYQAYLPKLESLGFVRGRLELEQIIRKPWTTDLACHYEDFTSDIVYNQVLAWTLRLVCQCGLCTPRVLPTVRRAYRALQRFVTLEPLDSDACLRLQYHRLNEDYQPLHGLRRFFLENTGPTHTTGRNDMLPFLVDMARLFELFVAQWLRAHLPPFLCLQAQELVHVGESGSLWFTIDIVLYNSTNSNPSCVIDTKYKASVGCQARDKR